MLCASIVCSGSPTRCRFVFCWNHIQTHFCFNAIIISFYNKHESNAIIISAILYRRWICRVRGKGLQSNGDVADAMTPHVTSSRAPSQDDNRSFRYTARNPRYKCRKSRAFSALLRLKLLCIYYYRDSYNDVIDDTRLHLYRFHITRNVYRVEIFFTLMFWEAYDKRLCCKSTIWLYGK